MRARSSLRGRVGSWFAVALVLLYGTGAVLGWTQARRLGRLFVELSLKGEVEDLVSYLRESGRLDAPELLREEREPIRTWLRVVRDGVVVAVAPEAPTLPPLASRSAGEVVSAAYLSTPQAYLIIRHVVGGAQAGTVVEGIADLRGVEARERRLAAALALAGLVVIPLAAWGGRLLAARALSPLQGLVTDLGRLGPGRPGERLVESSGAVEEVARLASAFNELLARLEENVELMRRFTADASHEIRNPLSVLQAGLEIALRRERAPEEYRALLRENLQEIERLRAVVEGLLALTRSAPGEPYPLRRERVDLGSLVAEGIDRFELVAAERGVDLERRLSPGIEVDGDSALLRLVVFNLVDNALKHGPDGMPITVTLSATDSSARLLVADAGPGVPAEAEPHVFDRFYRGSAAQSGVGGLGLSVVRWVVELHEGTVGLQSSGLGATFEVVLPLPPLASGSGSPAPAA